MLETNLLKEDVWGDMSFKCQVGFASMLTMRWVASCHFYRKICLVALVNFREKLTCFRSKG